VEAGLAAIILAAILAIVWLVVGKRTREARRAIEREDRAGGATLPDVTRPAPPVIDFHVQGEEALVTFRVPLPEGEVDEVLRDLLIQEAVEVVREKRHHLPISGVHRVVALASSGEKPRRVGEVHLEEPGVLPPPASMQSIVNLTHIGYDPLEDQFQEQLQHPPGLVTVERSDELGPIGLDLRLPTAVDVGLRTLGVDPETMTSGELVTSLLRLFEYRVMPTNGNTYTAEKGGVRTFIRYVPHGAGDHPELESDEIQRFIIEFQGSAANRGLLVTDKYCPFEVYERERREPRVRFVTRERLQKFIDAMALT
jgi:hypothetical protein